MYSGVLSLKFKLIMTVILSDPERSERGVEGPAVVFRSCQKRPQIGLSRQLHFAAASTRIPRGKWRPITGAICSSSFIMLTNCSG